ncbi:MAG: phosphoglycerate dehydrogenase [Chitinispirillales bacterium]|jgi:D-3-phosphoglycerate dehydrogenase|nr:phosphoglycerate dehydrogenase [Chitinispirillales bacterium]
MYKIQTLNKIAAVGLDKLGRDNYEIASEVSNPDGIILRSFKMHDMELPKSLKAVARAGAGVNNIPIEKCTQNGIVVFNTPGANANGVKELAIAALLISSRDIIGGVNWVQTLKGQGDEVPNSVEKGKAEFGGCEIKGKTMGVIGLGAIGVLVANAAAELGMNVVGCDPYISIEAAWGLSPKVKRANALEALIRESDYISIHVPYIDATKGMFNQEKLSLCKDGVRIINLARGGLVVNKDMKAALESGKIAYYVTDFPDEEVITYKNVIALPHIGASTEESEDNCAIMAALEIKDYLENGNIKNSVNFPDVCVDRNPAKTRITIANKNIPNMVGQISSLLACAGINISEMVNKHLDEIAYNIIDTDSKVTDDVVAKISAIDGVISVRVI